MTASKTFFSYARADGELVLRLAKDLRASGVDLWLDQLDIPAGARWDSEIEKALDAAERLIVVLSPDSVASVNVMDEVSFALEQGKRVVPVLLQECKIPMRLRRVQHVDFTGDYRAGLTQLLTQLSKSLEARSEESGTSHPFPSPIPEPADAMPVSSSPEPIPSGSPFPWKLVAPLVVVVIAVIVGWYQVFDQEPEGSSATVVVAGHEFEYSANASVTKCTGAIDPKEDLSQVELKNQSGRTITAKWAVINMKDLYLIEIVPGESNTVTPMKGNELCIFDTETSEEIVSFQIREEKHSVEISK